MNDMIVSWFFRTWSSAPRKWHPGVRKPTGRIFGSQECAVWFIANFGSCDQKWVTKWWFAPLDIHGDLGMSLGIFCLYNYQSDVREDPRSLPVERPHTLFEALLGVESQGPKPWANRPAKSLFSCWLNLHFCCFNLSFCYIPQSPISISQLSIILNFKLYWLHLIFESWKTILHTQRHV